MSREAKVLIALCAFVSASASAALADLGFSRSVTAGLIDRYARQLGPDARRHLQGWKDFVRSAAERAGPARGGAGETGLLRPVNSFFNHLPAVTDPAQWRVEDYWTTPAEFLSVYAGDCEDYAIAKYFTLKELGVPVARLRLVYARTWRSSAAHMVLAYYAAPGAEPLIMDNLQGSIDAAAARPDLTPVYMFNDDDLQFLQQGRPGVRYDVLSIRKWRDLLDKLARELTH